MYALANWPTGQEYFDIATTRAHGKNTLAGAQWSFWYFRDDRWDAERSDHERGGE